VNSSEMLSPPYVPYLTFYKEKDEMFLLKRHETLDSEQDGKKTIFLKKRLKITTHRMAIYFFQNHINLVANFKPNYLILHKRNFKIFNQKYN